MPFNGLMSLIKTSNYLANRKGWADSICRSLLRMSSHTGSSCRFWRILWKEKKKNFLFEIYSFVLVKNGYYITLHCTFFVSYMKL